MANWTRKKNNGCWSPSDNVATAAKSRSPPLGLHPHFREHVWSSTPITAVDVASVQLVLQITAQTFFIGGEVLVSHIIKMSGHNLSQIRDGIALQSLWLRDVGTWIIIRENGRIHTPGHCSSRQVKLNESTGRSLCIFSNKLETNFLSSPYQPST